MPTNHAILSASSSHRWLECPPSAKLCAELPDTSSEYAQEGTDAHALCEHRLKALLGRETTDPISIRWSRKQTRYARTWENPQRN